MSAERSYTSKEQARDGPIAMQTPENVIEKSVGSPLQIWIRALSGEGQTTLSLLPLTMSDLEDYYTLHADPRVWEHLPSGRHTTLQRSKEDLQSQVADWDASGLGYWAIRDEAGHLAGIGGVRLKGDGMMWNLYYRVSPTYWGKGIAAKVGAVAVREAHGVRPDLPVVAYMLENNTASKRIAEKVLSPELRWRGPDAGIDDPTAIRLVYSDRLLSTTEMEIVTRPNP